ncbi:MAG: hypothetical protein LBH13_09825 [Cellulomonadaceae bacterium]|jgi:2,3,4,5-tetrahydropyridine-2-carboxylate N-succinyltransferase|nr:hypothetical protein [Cellulomonadaceae bacterium]
MSHARSAWGHGLATVTIPEILGTQDPVTLDAWFPKLKVSLDGEHVAPTGFDANDDLALLPTVDEARGVETEVVSIEIDLDQPPVDSIDAYLRLHLLSTRLVEPNSINLDGIVDVLPTVVWTDYGACSDDAFGATRARLHARYGRPVSVFSVDKFPRMVDYVIPADVRIADADRVRLGAHLAAGTRVTHLGFVDYNAGTLSKTTVDGPIAQGTILRGDPDEVIKFD